MRRLDLIVLAAGTGSRFGHDEPKQFFEINGVPVFAKTILAVQNEDWINNIILVINENFEERYSSIIEKFKLRVDIKVKGGDHRLDSIKNAMDAVKTDSIILMEAARPFAKKDLYQKLIDHKDKNVIAVVESSYTPYIFKDGKLVEAISTSNMVLSTTPKKYSTKDLNSKLVDIDYSKNDDAEMMLSFGLGFVYSPSINIKITEPIDKYIATQIDKDEKEKK